MDVPPSVATVAGGFAYYSGASARAMGHSTTAEYYDLRGAASYLEAGLLWLKSLCCWGSPSYAFSS
jgi:hypothetical protein